MQNDNKLAAFMAAMVSAAEAEAAEMRETAADEEAAALAECRAGTETDSEKRIAAAVRYFTEKHIEINDGIPETVGKVAVGHGDFIEVRQHGQVFGNGCILVVHIVFRTFL